MSSERGERGPQGDHGQDGRQGPPGPSGITRVQALVFFLVFVTAAVLYGLQLQSVVDAQEEQRQESRYEGCLSGVELLTIFNDQQQGLAEVDRDVKDSLTNQETAAIVQRRIDLYESGILPLPDCEPLKPKP